MGDNKPGEFTVFPVPDTGIVLKIKKVPHVLIEDVQKQVLREQPEPQPPEQTVDLLGQTTVEKNWSDPAYTIAHDAWKARVNELVEERTRRVLVKLGVAKHLEMDDAMRAQVEELRADLREVGVELDPDDRYVWVTRVALATVEDWSDFITYLVRRNTPTAQAVAEAVQKF